MLENELGQKSMGFDGQPRLRGAHEYELQAFIMPVTTDLYEEIMIAERRCQDRTKCDKYNPEPRFVWQTSASVFNLTATRSLQRLLSFASLDEHETTYASRFFNAKGGRNCERDCI